PFPYTTLFRSVSSPSSTYPDTVSGHRADDETTKCSEPLCPTTGVTGAGEACSASWVSVTSPSSLLQAHAPIPPAHLSFSSSPRSRCLCRLLSAPAASRIFSTL